MFVTVSVKSYSVLRIGTHCPVSAKYDSCPRVGELTAGDSMRVALSIVGLILVIVGGIWFLQGIGVLPGSFMTGQIQWAVYGGMAVAAGVAVLLAVRRRRG